MKLNDLTPNYGAKKKRRRVGHGMAAGQGKTSGRGTKGEGSRAGTGGHLYRQGGNLPFYRRLPFIRGEGFTPPFQVTFNEINLDQLSQFAAGDEITHAVLAEANMLHKVQNPVVILGRGEVTIPLHVKIHRVSKSARTKIEAAGGSIEIIAAADSAK
jgi:large subunit ribosomal protein L15